MSPAAESRDAQAPSVPTPAQTIAAARDDSMSAEQLARVADDLKESLQEREAAYLQLQAYVHDLHRVIGERNRALDTVKAVENMKKNFLSNMSHEFRTPLTAVLGFSEFLRAREADAERRDLLERVVRAGGRIESLVDRLLTTARLDSGSLPVEPRLCDVPGIVAATAGKFAPIAAAKALELVVKLPEFDAMPIVADGLRLAQALEVLIDNAVKFTSKGSVGVTLLADPATRLPLQIEVSDQGRGIAPEFQGRIYSRFEQEDGSSTRQYEGVGLGLAMARALADLIGASLSFESELGVGSKFIISLSHVRSHAQAFSGPTAR